MESNPTTNTTTTVQPTRTRSGSHQLSVESIRIHILCSLITVVTANQQMRSTTNLLIINLAAADILFVIFCVPFTATDYVLPEWPFGDLWCKFVSVSFRLVRLNRLLYSRSLVAILQFTLHKYDAVIWNYKRNLTESRAEVLYFCFAFFKREKCIVYFDYTPRCSI